jgi:xylulokinase
LAGVGSGLWASVDAACEAIIRVKQRVATRPDVVAKMNSCYAAYRRVYPATRAIFET